MKDFHSRILRRLSTGTLAKLMGTITHVLTNENVAALTFDDGPHPEFTPQLLDVLKRHNAQATFFMIGKSARLHPDIVKRVSQAGHAICNHSWSHTSFPSISGKERRKQLRECQNALSPFGEKIFRPPRGHQTIASRLDAFLLGFEVITWNVHAYDWERHDGGWMADKLLSRLQPGSIILLHDYLWDKSIKDAEDRSPMLEALDMFLERVGSGFQFLTIPDLLKFGHAHRQSWYVRNDSDW